MNDKTKVTLDDDLEGLSAEELAELANVDDGSAVIEHDQQNFTIEGIDDLNNSDTEEETDEDVVADDAESELEPETDAEAEAEPESEEVPEVAPEPEQSAEPESTPEEQGPTLQDRIEEIQEELKLLGDKLEDGEIDFREYNKQNNDLVEEREDLKATVRENERYVKSEQDSIEQQWNEASDKFLSEPGNEIIGSDQAVQEQYMASYRAINNSKEAKGKDFLWKMNKAKEHMVNVISKLNGGQENKTPSKDTESESASNSVDDKIAQVENTNNPPSSLSSISSANDNEKPGRIKMDNATDGADIQTLMDRAAESDDPEAIDKLLSSVDFDQ